MSVTISRARLLDTPRDALTQLVSVHPNAGVAAAASSLRVDIRRFPWINRLAADYAFDPARLSSFFAGDVRDARRLACRPSPARRPIRGSATPWRRSGRSAAGPARRAGRRHEAPRRACGIPRTVAIVTGQQAGLFGGPLFTVLKALTALRLAEVVRDTYDVPTVAVFWVDAEDHDWQEVNSAASWTPRRRSARWPSRARLRRRAARSRASSWVRRSRRRWTRWQRRCRRRSSRPTLLADLRARYAPGRGMVDAFSRWLESLLGPRGLVVYESSDPAPSRSSPTSSPGAGERRRNGPAAPATPAGRCEALGYHAQVTPHPDSAALFWTRRQAGHRSAPPTDGLQVGERVETREALAARARQHPEEFSPNVLLRPLVQDSLFPTACYVAGPSELAYLAQLRAVYEAFGIPMPLVQPRATATLVDANAARFLSRGDVAIESLRPQDESALNALLEAALPPSVEAAVDGVLRH